MDPSHEQFAINTLEALALEHNRRINELMRMFAEQGIDTYKIDADAYQIDLSDPIDQELEEHLSKKEDEAEKIGDDLRNED